MANSLKVKILK